MSYVKPSKRHPGKIYHSLGSWKTSRMLLGISVRDVLDQSNELFKEDVAGDDFLLEVLRLMNMIKKRLEFQEMLQQFNITSIYKKKRMT